MASSFMINADVFLAKYPLPQRVRGELRALFSTNLASALSTTRVSRKQASFDTQEKRLWTICSTLVLIRKLGFKIESIYSVDGRHLRAVVASWIEKGDGVGTMQTKLSHLKAFAEWMGKYGLVKSLYEYRPKSELEEMGRSRKYVSTTDKSWEAAGVDVVAKIEEIARIDPIVAVQMKLQWAFGLRVRESFLLQPRKVAMDLRSRGDGKFLVSRGTKGSRERDVPFQVKAMVLAEAMKYANMRTGSTTPDDYTVSSWRNHYYKVMAACGLTKNELGVTSHGLRHQWAQDYYKVVSGYDAPIKGSEERPDSEANKAAMALVVEALGHSMPSKTGMYLSTFAAMDRLKAPVVGIEEVQRALEETGGEKKAAAAKLGISRQALYRILDKQKLVAAE